MNRSNQPDDPRGHLRSHVYQWLGGSTIACLLLGSACADPSGPSAQGGATEGPTRGDSDDDPSMSGDSNDDTSMSGDSDDDGPDPTGGSGSGRGADIRRYAEAYCGHFADCCGEVQYLGTYEECVAMFDSPESPMELDPESEIVYQPECMQQIIEAIEAEPMCSPEVHDLFGYAFDSCDACSIFTGSLATGEDCLSGANLCGKGDVCVYVEDGAKFRCVPRCSAAVGQPCSYDVECEAGSDCIEEVCRPPSSLGDSCDLSLECEPPAICEPIWNEDGSSGGRMCMQPAPVGEPCDPGCGSDAWCEYEPGGGVEDTTCVPRPRLGEPCEEHGFPCFESDCSSDGVCAPELCS